MSVQNVLKLCTKPYEVGPNVQYGKVSVSGGTGSVTVNLPKAYTDLSYVVIAEMGDTPASQTFVTPLTTSSFTLGWQSAGTGAHTLQYVCYGTSYSIFGIGTASTT